MDTEHTTSTGSSMGATVAAYVVTLLIVAGFAAIVAAIESTDYRTVLIAVGLPLAFWGFFAVTALGRDSEAGVH
ncbi:MAG TPA: hypothetical protein VEV13_04530 [Candidatus Limnocylindria bacterium]|nr:hypothetical protein [Candidatus Limnocylindria bacterium]